MKLGPDEGRVSPGSVVQGYRIERKLGEGGYGQVYLASQDGRLYALKFINLKYFGGWARRELSMLVHFKHPNVVRLVGHLEWPELAPEFLVLVMEYVPGRSLYEWAREENPPARELVRVLLELVRALADLHSLQALHRDLKGDNVLVRDADGVPVLVDFGAGFFPWTPRVTRDFLAPGAPPYRSPEALRFLLSPERQDGDVYRYSPSDELFSLGVTLYVLLTRVHPFRGRDLLELMGSILRTEPQAPHALNPRVPRALGELCLRLLEKDPKDRPASASALGEALEAARDGADASWDVPLFPPAPAPVVAEAPVLAAPPAKGRPRRRRALLGAGAVLGLLGLAGGLVLGLLPRDRAVSPPPLPMSDVGSGLEVAPPWLALEAAEGAAPPWADTPAPVTPVTLGKGEAHVKKKGNGSTKKVRLVLGATAAATQLACPAAQVRLEPVPHACPAGSVEVMTGTLGLPVGDMSGNAAFAGWEKRKPIPVQEGPFSVELQGHWMAGSDHMGRGGQRVLPTGTRLSGQLRIGEKRVYGFITQAVTPSGDTFPVCMELIDYGERGVEIEPDGGAVKISPFVEVMSVERFG